MHGNFFYFSKEILFTILLPKILGVYFSHTINKHYYYQLSKVSITNEIGTKKTHSKVIFQS